MSWLFSEWSNDGFQSQTTSQVLEEFKKTFCLGNKNVQAYSSSEKKLVSSLIGTRVKYRESTFSNTVFPTYGHF